MLEANDSFISELALHIVTLADFWRRKNTKVKSGAELRIIQTLIETGLDINLEYAEPIANLVVKELDALDAAGFGHDANATKWRVEVVSTVLRQNAIIEKRAPHPIRGECPALKPRPVPDYGREVFAAKVYQPRQSVMSAVGLAEVEATMWSLPKHPLPVAFGPGLVALLALGTSSTQARRQ